MVANTKYRPEIDGLRAIAIGVVLLYHLGMAPSNGGFVGVDVFFVIGGYLITSILIAEMNRGDFSFLAFYERRARRLFPALFIVCFVSAAATIFFIPPYYQSQFGQNLSATALFSANFLFWWEDGYFDFASELKPLLHMWSLGIEEQFYLVTPLVLFLCRRYRSGLKTAMFVLSGLTAASLCISIVETSLGLSSAFFYCHPDSGSWV